MRTTRWRSSWPCFLPYIWSLQTISASTNFEIFRLRFFLSLPEAQLKTEVGKPFVWFWLAKTLICCYYLHCELSGRATIPHPSFVTFIQTGEVQQSHLEQDVQRAYDNNYTEQQMSNGYNAQCSPSTFNVQLILSHKWTFLCQICSVQDRQTQAAQASPFSCLWW